MTTADAMILLGSINEVKINGKGANYVDCRFQVAFLYDIPDFLVYCGNFCTQQGTFRFRSVSETLSTLPESLTAQPQPLFGVKDSGSAMPQDSTTKSVSQC